MFDCKPFTYRQAYVENRSILLVSYRSYNRFIYISIGGKEDEGEGHIDRGNRYYPFIWNFTYTKVENGFENNVASDEFIQLMYDGGVGELTQEQLKQYKDDINQELIKLKHRQSFEKIYLSLGKIASLEEGYEDSNNYLLNVISPGSHTNKMIDLKVYETLAVNYIAMGDIEKRIFLF